MSKKYVHAPVMRPPRSKVKLNTKKRIREHKSRHDARFQEERERARERRHGVDE